MGVRQIKASQPELLRQLKTVHGMGHGLFARLENCVDPRQQPVPSLCIHRLEFWRVLPVIHRCQRKLFQVSLLLFIPSGLCEQTPDLLVHFAAQIMMRLRRQLKVRYPWPSLYASQSFDADTCVNLA